MLVFRYQKGTWGYYFYSKSDIKVFVSTNSKFMEEEYIMNHIIREMNEWTEKTEFPSIQDNVVPVDPQPLIPILIHQICLIVVGGSLDHLLSSR